MDLFTRSRHPVAALTALTLAGLVTHGCDKLRALTGRDGASPGTTQTPAPSPGAAALGPLSGGQEHTCAVKPTGEVFCWGRNLDNELGDGTSRDRATPAPVPGLTGATQVSCGGFHTCAVRSSGEVFCWGRNTDGQLGDGTTEVRAAPVQVRGIADAVQVTAGHDFSCAVRREGKVMCWGNGASGRLGNGGTRDSSTPVEVAGLADATQIDAGYGHTCARRSNGEVSCWGANSARQSGQGPRVSDVTRAAAVPGLAGVAQVAAGSQTTCAVGAGGELWCWGHNYRGQVGNGQHGTGAAIYAEAPFAVPLRDVAQVDVGDYHACARLRAGAMHCWGSDGYGNLGGEQRGDHDTPSPVARLDDATAIALGDQHTCALRRSGAVACWGRNDSGELAVERADDAYHAIDRVPSLAALAGEAPTAATFPAANAGPVRPTLSVSEGYACAVRSDGHVLCWGYNNSGELGNGNTAASQDRAVEVAGLTDAVEVRTTSNKACARRANGTVACWGSIDRIIAGLERVRTSRPVPVEGITDAAEVALRGSIFCVRHAGGTVSCRRERALVPVDGLTNVAQLAASYSAACARRDDGKVFCWGDGGHGLLGNGSDERSATPVEVVGIDDAVDLVAFNTQVCVLRRSGRVACWGSNERGTLGNGESGERLHSNRPVEVAGLRDVTSIAVGLDTACALRRSGEVVCWGSNNFGQAGVAHGADGQRVDPVLRPTPVAAGTHPALAPMGRVARLECGWHVCCALHESSGVSCWGTSAVLGSGAFGGLFSGRSEVPLPLTHLTLQVGAPANAAATPAPAPLVAQAEAPPPAPPTEEAPAATPSPEEPEDEAPTRRHRRHRGGWCKDHPGEVNPTTRQTCPR